MNRSGALSTLAHRKIYFALGGALLAMLAAFSAFSKEVDKTDTSTPGPLVRIYTLTAGNERHFQLTGTVQARVESNLGFRVTGKIVRRLVDQGQHVRKDQALMELDMTDLELAQKAAQANVVAASAEKLRAVQDEERQRVLVKQQAVSQKEYDLAKALADSTTARLLAAEAAARQAENQVQYAVLKADADGVVTAVSADIGQVVATGQNVVSLAQNGTREAVVYLPETMIAHAKDAKEAFLYSDPATRFSAALRELSATADQTTRTYQARYTLEGEGQSAPLGSTITVSFVKPDARSLGTYRVPIGALYDNGNGSSVWVIDAATSTVHAQSVIITELGEEFAGIAGALSEGDQVVALGAHLLKENKKIRTDKTEMTGEK